MASTLPVLLVLILTGCAGERADGVAGSQAPGAAPEAAKSQPGGSAGEVRLAAAAPRRIIYTADAELTVESLSTGEQTLVRLVRTHGGFIARKEVSGTEGTPRSGSWTARIPSARFDQFMAALPQAGEVQRVRTDSQDVTEEYFDVEARLSNKRVEEQRLLQHLRTSTARLQDVLAVERELSRVREEVERLQGRIRLLSDQTELSTVSVRIFEVADYFPPGGTTFAARVGRTFHESLGMLRAFGQGVVLLVVALAPWLVVLALLAAPVWLLIRRHAARHPRPQSR